MIFALQRLRLADEEPLAIEESRMLNFKGCEALAEEDFEHHSLYRLLEIQYGVPLMEADQEIEAGLAGRRKSRSSSRFAVGSSGALHAAHDLHRPQPARGVCQVGLYAAPNTPSITHLKRDQLFS